MRVGNGSVCWFQSKPLGYPLLLGQRLDLWVVTEKGSGVFLLNDMLSSIFH